MSQTSLDETVKFRLSTRDLALLDQVRGKATRGTFLRSLIRQAASSSTAKANAKPPTKQDALKLLASHAEHDSAAAIELVQRMSQEEELDRLRKLTAG
jgi:hypothetical protein